MNLKMENLSRRKKEKVKERETEDRERTHEEQNKKCGLKGIKKQKSEDARRRRIDGGEQKDNK